MNEVIRNHTVSLKSKKAYSFLFVFSFILNGYGLGIDGMSIGSMIFMLYSLVSILIIIKKSDQFRFGKQSCFSGPLLLLVFVFISCLFSLLTLYTGQYSISSMMLGSAKLAIWAISISITNYIFFDYKIVYKWMIRISIIATLYLFLQYIAWYGISLYLPNIFNLVIIKPYHEDYLNYADLINYASTYFRPASFFSEPGFYSNLVLCTLTMMIFGTEARLSKKYKIWCLVLSIGVILATSTSGIYMLIFLWLYYLIRNIKKPLVLNIFLFIMLVTMSFTILNIQTDNLLDDLGVFGQTLKYTLEKPSNFSNSMRIGKSYEYLDELTNINNFIGIGVGNERAYLNSTSVYMNSITTLIYWCGYLGLFVFIIFLIFILGGNNDQCAFVLLTMYTIKLFTSGIMFSIYGILFLSIIIYRGKYLK